MAELSKDMIRHMNYFKLRYKCHSEPGPDDFLCYSSCLAFNKLSTTFVRDDGLRLNEWEDLCFAVDHRQIGC